MNNEQKTVCHTHCIHERCTIGDHLRAGVLDQ
ncbi:hypothetical protein [Gilvibacter sp.]